MVGNGWYLAVVSGPRTRGAQQRSRLSVRQCHDSWELSIAQTGPLPTYLPDVLLRPDSGESSINGSRPGTIYCSQSATQPFRRPNTLNIIPGHWRRLILGAAQVMSDVPQTSLV